MEAFQPAEVIIFPMALLRESLRESLQSQAGNKRIDGGELPTWELDTSTGRDAPYKIVAKAGVLFGMLPP